MAKQNKSNSIPEGRPLNNPGSNKIIIIGQIPTMKNPPPPPPKIKD
ncbi:hypothetical protein KO504_13270 [Winogradskyella psychrotolerans]|nr:hypothetical protein [Winogradskyella psychrotolerans]MBU2922317.1 hypothetical protein [Winogradskyella psychrotolerans]